MVKRLHKKHFKAPYQKRNYLKDLSLRNFILQHEKEILLSFSNMIIPPVLNTFKENSVTNIHKFNSINAKIEMIDTFLKKNLFSNSSEE